MTEATLTEGDHVLQWLEESTERDALGWEAMTELYSSYTKWCARNAVARPLKPNSLGQRLRGLGFESEKRGGHESVRGRSGLRLKRDVFGNVAA
jgi:phage/plasmid-associated DNA primase